MTELWIVVPNWREFQHYTDRDPTWIKSYTRLLNDDDYLGLTMRQRGILHGLWLLYAACDGLVRGSSPARLGLMLGDDSVRTRDIAALNHAGFIQLSASRPLALRYQLASPEKEREKKDPLTPTSGGNLASNNTMQIDPVECHACGSPVDRGHVCPTCGASPRAAGTNPRAATRAKPKSPYDLAETMTRNGGWQYELPAFQDELDRYDLTTIDRALLEQVRDECARQASVHANDDLPSFDDPL